MDKFEAWREAMEKGHTQEALDAFNELYDRKKEFHTMFRQCVRVAARHKPGPKELHAFLPLSAVLESMQFLRSREEVGLMGRRLTQYLCAIRKQGLPKEPWPEEEGFREAASERVRQAGHAFGKKPQDFVFNAAAKEVADYVGWPEAAYVLPLMKENKAKAPEKMRAPTKHVDEGLLAAAARGKLVEANYIVKMRRHFSAKEELHLLALLEKHAGRGKALTEKDIVSWVGKGHRGRKAHVHPMEGMNPADVMLAHLLEQNLSHAAQVLRAGVAEHRSLRSLYPALLLGGYYGGPAGNLEGFVWGNAACQLSERIEKPHALIPLAQGLRGIAERRKAHCGIDIPSKIAFPWE